MTRSKRLFDICVTVLAAPLWVPVCAIAALALLVTAGRPVLYRSQRRVHGEGSRTVVKFRTMVRNADRILNRETVPMVGTAFLNIPPDHPVYTPVGRFIERYALTELPQLLHVLAGTMSLIGNRPLPQNVVDALLKDHPHAQDRFLAPGGLTGPVQLIGRDFVSDEDRLSLEIDYCLLATLRYSYRIDLYILWSTVLVALHVRPPFSVAQVRELMMRAAAPGAEPVGGAERREAGLRFSLPPVRGASAGEPELIEISYRGLRVLLDRAAEPGSTLPVPTSTGEPLLAQVCWSRPRDDGRHEVGLTLHPEAEAADRLVALMPPQRRRRSPAHAGHARVRPSLQAAGTDASDDSPAGPPASLHAR